MSEKRPMIPVVEVRETFTPSELLRGELKRFLSPTLDSQTAESLRATFLFKSWRRRLIESSDFARERERGGPVYQATRQFEQIPHVPIPLIGVTVLDGGENATRSRLVLKVPMISPYMEAAMILESIPTIEANSDTVDSQTLLYADVAADSILRSTEGRREQLRQLRMKLRDPKFRSRMNVVPTAITQRDTLAPSPYFLTDTEDEQTDAKPV